MSQKHIERDSLVHDAVVTYKGQSRRASYFVEHGQIHVRTGRKLFRLPRTAQSPADAVRGLLLGLAADADREASHAAKWADILGRRAQTT